MKLVIGVDWIAQQLCIKQRKKHKRPKLIFSVSIGQITFRGIDMSFLLPDDKQAQVAVSAVDAKGQPAQVENIRFASSDEVVAAIDSFGLITANTVGAAQISVTVDALIGEGEEDLVGLLDVEVIAGKAVALTVSAALV